jgi:hypothetical protein
MAPIIGLLAPRVGKTLASFIAYGGLVLLLVGALLWWGHTKYEAGVRDTDAKYAAASAKLKEQARVSAARADAKAEQRVEQFTAKVAEEKEKLDEAERTGSSPLDVLFGPGGL